MGPLRQMGQHQALPVALQLILGAGCGKHQSAAPFPGLHEKMDLGVVAQGFKMSDSLHRGCNGLPVDDAALSEGSLQAKPVLQHPPQHFQLHLAHQLHPNLPGSLIPAHPQLRIFLFQLPQIFHGGMGIRAVGELQAAGQDRLQNRRRPVLFPSQTHARYGMAQSGHRAYGTCRSLLHRAELGTGVYPQLVRLLLPNLRLGQALSAAADQILDMQRPAGDLQMGQPGSLSVPGHLEYPGAKFRWICGHRTVFRQSLQQRIHTLQLQR